MGVVTIFRYVRHAASVDNFRTYEEVETSRMFECDRKFIKVYSNSSNNIYTYIHVESYSIYTLTHCSNDFVIATHIWKH